MLEAQFRRFMKKIPLTGSGQISGSLTSHSLTKIFQMISFLLQENKLKWEDQVFMDAGMGEGFPLVKALNEYKCRMGFGVENQKNPLLASWQGLRFCQVTNLPLTWCYTDLEYVTSLEGISILYTFNYTFGETTLHLLKLIESSKSMQLVVMTLRGFRTCLQPFLKRTLYEQILHKEDIELALRWNQIKPKKKVKVSMGGQKLQFIFFVRSDWTTEASVIPTSMCWVPQNSVDNRTVYSWNLGEVEEEMKQKVVEFEQTLSMLDKQELQREHELKKQNQNQTDQKKKRKREKRKAATTLISID